MQVLKHLVMRESAALDSDPTESRSLDQKTDIQHRLLCTVTAFELLSGQGVSHSAICRQLGLTRPDIR